MEEPPVDVAAPGGAEEAPEPEGPEVSAAHDDGPGTGGDADAEGPVDGQGHVDAGPGEVEGPATLRVTSWSLVRAVLVVAGFLVVARIAVAASTMLWWLAIATAAAGALHPLVTALRRWMPGWAAILVVIVGVLAVVGSVGYRGVAELTSQFEQLRGYAFDVARSVQSSRQFGQVASEFGLVDKTSDLFAHLPLVMGGGGDDAAATVQSAASSGSAVFAIATFAVLMLLFGSRFVQAALDQVDDLRVRRRLAGLVVRAYRDASRYTWLMAVRAVAVGLLGALVCQAVDLGTPTAVGVAFAVLSLIPGLGILLAAVPLAVYAAVASVPAGVLLVAGAVLVQALDAVMVQRRIERASVHVGPTATIVAALVGLQLYGPGGALVGLAVAVYGLAVLSHLTQAHDEVFTAVRHLVGDGRAEGSPEWRGAGRPAPGGEPGAAP